MSCCCCLGLEWCAKVCCARLYKQKESSYVGIQFSPVSKGELLLSNNQKEIIGAMASNDAPAHHSQYSASTAANLYPILDTLVRKPSRSITEQPSVEHLKKLQLADAKSSCKVGLFPVEFQSLIMYREKAIDPTRDAVVQFSLQYDTHQSKLRVDLQYASNLMGSCNGDPIQCHPLVKLHLVPDREEAFQSKIIKETRDPVFNQIFHFGGLLIEYMKHQTLVLGFYNHALNNKPIGKACLQLRDVDLLGAVVQMRIIHTEKKESKSQGDLLVSLSYSPVHSKLEGMIHKATGLRELGWFGKPDPYIKVVITHKDRRIFKYKTCVKRNTSAPVYNESFFYEVQEDMKMAMDVEDMMISFYIIDFDRLSQRDAMGVVNIGKHANNELGRKHWREALQSPQQRISFWHPIQSVQQGTQISSRRCTPHPSMS